jgi:hypothetical protein
VETLSKISSLIPSEDIALGIQFLLKLPPFLRRPIHLEEANEILRRRFENREVDFLTIARNAIYPYPQSPYRQLLEMAGCTYGDLEKLVKQEGLEGALKTLFRHGVYLTVEEFKGRRPVVRKNLNMRVEQDQIRNRPTCGHILAESSGSRSGRT